MKNKVAKFENPKRVELLEPKKTLTAIEVTQDSHLLDYGAGTGVFSVPACEMIKGTVYAYDINEEMIGILEDKKVKHGLSNLEIIHGKDQLDIIPSKSLTHIILVTVLHEIDNKAEMFEHFDKLLQPGATVTIIEFQYKETKMGPSLSHRMKEEDITSLFESHKYTLVSGQEPNDVFVRLTYRRFYETIS